MTRLVFLFVLVISYAWAQQGNLQGNLKGVVLAPDGLPVPLASVEVKNTQTGLTKSATAAETTNRSIGRNQACRRETRD